MDKQRTVNAVTANDGFSSGLMDSYERWMGGDTFQNSTIKEEEIPTGQKQGGGTGASFTSVGGSLPAIEFDKSTGLPTIPELGVSDETGKKDPKATSNGGEPPTNNQGEKPKYGAQIRNTVLVGANEETKKAKKDHDGDGKVESGKAEYFGSKDKAIKKAMKKEEAACDTKSEGYGKKKKVKKEEVDIMDTQEWKDAAKKQTSRIMDIWKKTH